MVVIKTALEFMVLELGIIYCHEPNFKPIGNYRPYNILLEFPGT